MTKWPMVSLSEVLTPRNTDVEVSSDGEYHFAGVFCFGGGAFVGQKKTGLEFAYKRLTRLQKHDFTYPKLMAWEGAFAVVPPECDGLVVSPEFPVFAIDQAMAAPEFIGYYFSMASVWPEVAGQSTGTNVRRQRLHPSKLLKYKIPLPPLKQQRQLVEHIDALRAKIDEAKKLRMEADLQTVSLTNAVRRSLFGEKPDQDWIPLSNYVSNIENGWSPACEKRRAAEGEWAVLKVGAVSFGTYDPTENKALPKSLTPIPEYQVQAGDFLMSRANTAELVGACAFVEETPSHRMLSDKLFRFVFHPDVHVDRLYLDHVLKSPAVRDQIVRVASGTSPTMKNISKEKVLALQIPNHSYPQQQELAARLGSTQVLINKTSKTQTELSTELDAMLPGILDKVFNGEPYRD